MSERENDEVVTRRRKFLDQSPHLQSIVDTELMKIDPVTQTDILEYYNKKKLPRIAKDSPRFSRLLQASQLLRNQDIIDFCLDQWFDCTLTMANSVVVYNVLCENTSGERYLPKLEYFLAKNFREFCRTREFVQLKTFQLKSVLKNVGLDITSMEEIITALFTWVESDPENRAKSLKDFTTLEYDWRSQPIADGADDCITCYFQNVNSLKINQATKKADHFQDFMSVSDYDFICINETKLERKMEHGQEISFKEPEGFRCFRKDVNRRSGGVLTLVRDVFVSEEIAVTTNLQLLIVKVKNCNDEPEKNILLANVYFPKPTNDLYIELARILTIVAKEDGDHLLLVGDFNSTRFIHAMRGCSNMHSANLYFEPIFHDLKLVQRSNIECLSGSLLQLVFSRAEEGLTVRKDFQAVKSDHVGLNIKTPWNRSRFVMEPLKKIDVWRMNWDLFRKNLSDIVWAEAFYNDTFDVNSMYDTFCEEVMLQVTCATHKQKYDYPNWLPENFKYRLNLKEAVWRRYELTDTNEAYHVYSIVTKELIELIADCHEMSPTLHEDCCLDRYLEQNNPSQISCIRFTNEQVAHLFVELNVERTVEVDQLPPVLFKRCAFILDEPVTLLFNAMLHYGKQPAAFTQNQRYDVLKDVFGKLLHGYIEGL